MVIPVAEQLAYHKRAERHSIMYWWWCDVADNLYICVNVIIIIWRLLIVTLGLVSQTKSMGGCMPSYFIDRRCVDTAVTLITLPVLSNSTTYGNIFGGGLDILMICLSLLLEYSSYYVYVNLWTCCFSWTNTNFPFWPFWRNSIDFLHETYYKPSRNHALWG